MKYGCDKFFKFLHKLTSAIWDETTGQWWLKIRNLESSVEFDDTCHILINAAGVLKLVLEDILKRFSADLTTYLQSMDLACYPRNREVWW